jgi:hypothetical protein
MSGINRRQLLQLFALAPLAKAIEAVPAFLPVPDPNLFTLGKSDFTMEFWGRRGFSEMRITRGVGVRYTETFAGAGEWVEVWSDDQAPGNGPAGVKFFDA